MARVTLHIPRSYLAYHPHLRAQEALEVRDGETVLDLVRRLGLNELEFGIVVVRGERELMSYRPRDGEEIELLPIIHGGAPGPAPGAAPGFRVTSFELRVLPKDEKEEPREPATRNSKPATPIRGRTW